MKHLVTLLQVIIWLILDTLLFIYFLEWNMFLKAPGHSFKKKNGIVSYASNYDRRNGVKHIDNKYQAAFLL